MSKKRFVLFPAAVLLLALLLQGGIAAACGSQNMLPGEQGANERQPPEKVLDAIGLKPGMIVGEVGAGRGRYTIHLAARVGLGGLVYANDIDEAELGVLQDRCRRGKISNVKIIVGRIDDPLFPSKSLDLAFMVLTYHHLAKPVDLLQNLKLSLRPGATVVVIDPDPAKDPGRPTSEYTPRGKIEREAAAAGFEIVKVETFLPRDNLFILRVKDPAGI
jgi:ubiquinone/menaquinone biosynthesis C-methylase UbiE